MLRKKRLLSIETIIANLIAHFLFFTGLSVLIPFVALLGVPTGMIFVNKPLVQMALVALIFILASIVILYYYSHSLGRTFTNLGIITFFSGGIGILFSIYSKDVIFQVLQKHISMFDKIQPILDAYINHSLPKVRILTIGYIVLGIILLMIGHSINKKQRFVGWARRRYGPRVRIFR